MRIVDCFIFNDELQMLDFRLAEMSHAVDHHVLVEATKTISGQNKRLYFKENMPRYAQYLPKIIHVVVEDMPDRDISPPMTGEKLQYVMGMEHHQRRCIDRGITSLCLDDDDAITITDVDEVPDARTLDVIRKLRLPDQIFILDLATYYYDWTCKVHGGGCKSGGNCRFRERCQYNEKGEPIVPCRFGGECIDKCAFLHRCYGGWLMTKILNFRTYKASGSDSQTIRASVQPWQTHGITRGGWHCSYFGGPDAIIRKLQSFSHQEFNDPRYVDKDQIQEIISRRGDILLRPLGPYHHVPIVENTYLPDHYDMLLETA